MINYFQNKSIFVSPEGDNLRRPNSIFGDLLILKIKNSRIKINAKQNWLTEK